MIPYGHQSIDEDDIAAVVQVLRSDRITQGPHIEEFEAALAAKVGATFAILFASGTASLHAACAAAGLASGDRVATSTLSFAASANCAIYVGAHPVLLDIDPATLNLDLAGLPDDLDALVAVHFAGLPLDLATIRHRPRILIEDAAHALGAVTPDGPIGNCAHSDMCCFSFHPVKAITTGEGGAVTTNDPDLAARLRTFRTHGITPKPDDGGWCYDIDDLGFNYRMTDIQAALGTSQLGKLDRFLVRRTELADRYRALLAGAAVELPAVPTPPFTHGLHLFVVGVNNRRFVYDELRQRGVGVQVHYVPIHRHGVYRRLGYHPEQFPHAEKAYERLLSLPLYPDLLEADQDTVINHLEDLTGSSGCADG